MLAGKKVLIVADNAADADQVRPLLPGSAGCLVIVTSRSTLTGLIAVDGAIPLSLEALISAEARDLLARIIGDARVASEPEVAGQLVELCGHLPLALGVTAARAAARPGLPLAAADRLGDPALRARSHHYLARANAELARYDDADPHYRHALELFGQLGDNTWRANLHLGLAVTLDRQEQPGQAADQARQALELFTAAGYEVGQAEALNGIGWYLGRLGDYEQTRAYCQQALAISRQAGYRRIEADALDSLGYAYHHLGQHADAITCYQQALDIARELGYRYQQAEALNHLGDAQHATGNLETARTAWREALAILDNLCHPRAEQVRAKLCAAAEAPTSRT